MNKCIIIIIVAVIAVIIAAFLLLPLLSPHKPGPPSGLNRQPYALGIVVQQATPLFPLK